MRRCIAILALFISICVCGFSSCGVGQSDTTFIEAAKAEIREMKKTLPEYVDNGIYLVSAYVKEDTVCFIYQYGYAITKEDISTDSTEIANEKQTFIEQLSDQFKGEPMEKIKAEKVVFAYKYFNEKEELYRIVITSDDL